MTHPFLEACKERHISDILKYYDSSLIQNALKIACTHGDFELIEYFDEIEKLKQDDINYAFLKSAQLLPLVGDKSSNFFKTIELLLNLGADPYTQKNSAFYYFSQSGNKDIINYIVLERKIEIPQEFINDLKLILSIHSLESDHKEGAEYFLKVLDIFNTYNHLNDTLSGNIKNKINKI